MIDRGKHPVGWNFLLDELESAHEHLGNLIKEVSGNPEYSEEEFRIGLGHVYARLDGSWFRRNVPEDFPASEGNTASRFPDDLDPIGWGFRSSFPRKRESKDVAVDVASALDNLEIKNKVHGFPLSRGFQPTHVGS